MSTATQVQGSRFGFALPSSVEGWRKPRRHPISPLAGEMSGRTEGGGKDRQFSALSIPTGNQPEGVAVIDRQVGGTAPPSALPGISPGRGEIGSFTDGAIDGHWANA
ncbi:MAG: hypothetical protein E5Y65_13725 [Mesorhizobium sp.]|nr:MAG: hypothetical protein E5Y65_13725 [Mesorhizobium sp.]TIM03293.1 MAG: hypothetical protein E5Y64_01090 [Mesorhizobium sp.]